MTIMACCCVTSFADLLTNNIGGLQTNGFSTFDLNTVIGGLNEQSIEGGIGLENLNTSENMYLNYWDPDFDNWTLGDNGSWAATNGYSFAGGKEYQFNFAAPVAVAGGVMNYYVNPGFILSGVMLEALDSNGDVLESYDIVDLAPISTPGGFNIGDYRGIARATNDIYALRIIGSDRGPTIESITYAIPEPASALMICFGAALLTVFRKFYGRV